MRRISAVLSGHSANPTLRLRRASDDRPFLTDGGHLIVDLDLGSIAAPGELASALKGILGVVDHGLFVGMAALALIGPCGWVEEQRHGQAR